MDAMSALERAATAGPWTCTNDKYGILIPEVNGECEGCVGSLSFIDLEDAAFIAAARTFIPKALECIRELSEAIKKIDERANCQGLLIKWGLD